MQYVLNQLQPHGHMQLVKLTIKCIINYSLVFPLVVYDDLEIHL